MIIIPYHAKLTGSFTRFVVAHVLLRRYMLMILYISIYI